MKAALSLTNRKKKTEHPNNLGQLIHCRKSTVQRRRQIVIKLVKIEKKENSRSFVSHRGIKFNAVEIK